ncbi:MAG: methionyl-tRNA formyltransferase [Candidatus Aminicenantes bacterium]|nr:methionyl-tRNA formyltransferase [Candidatus Aminicenantes bacterium]
MRAVFFGSPETAFPSLQALLSAGHDVPLIVTQPDRPAGRGKRRHIVPVKEFALKQGIPVVSPDRIRKDSDILDRLRDTAADIHVVVAYGQIIPMPVIALPRLWTINVHFSLLPRYRGAAPVAAAILAGDSRTGVTIFRLNEKMDEGEVLADTETEIKPRDTAGELETRLAGIGAGLLLETLEKIDGLVPRPQDHSQATYAPKLKKEEGHLDWRRPAEEIDRRVRAMTPRPTAHTHLRGGRLIVLSGHPESLPEEFDQAAPGTVIGFSKTGILVACGGGTGYRLSVLQPENRKAMTAHAYSLGGKISVGDVLESRKIEATQKSDKI